MPLSFHDCVFIKNVPILKDLNNASVDTCKTELLNVIIENRVYRDGELDALFNEFNRRNKNFPGKVLDEIVMHSKHWLDD